MNNMNGRNNAVGSRRKGVVVAICIISMLIVGSLTLWIVGGAMKEAKKRSQEEVQQTVSEIDPFDRLTVKYSGISGAGRARTSDTNVNAVSSIDKSMSAMKQSFRI